MTTDPPPDDEIAEQFRHVDIVICEEDLAYAAGIIDGEGCISILKHRSHRRNFSYQVRLTVKMVDVGAILFLKKKFGGAVGRVENEAPFRPCYQWYLDGRQVVWVLTDILPHLRVKQRQAELAIEFYTFISSKRILPSEELERRERLYQAIHRLNKRGR